MSSWYLVLTVHASTYPEHNSHSDHAERDEWPASPRWVPSPCDNGERDPLTSTGLFGTPSEDEWPASPRWVPSPRAPSPCDDGTTRHGDTDSVASACLFGTADEWPASPRWVPSPRDVDGSDHESHINDIDMLAPPRPSPRPSPRFASPLASMPRALQAGDTWQSEHWPPADVQCPWYRDYALRSPVRPSQLDRHNVPSTNTVL